ncbi:hypothetical protein ACFLYR_08765 [Chloroflexota bacterium]
MKLGAKERFLDALAEEEVEVELPFTGEPSASRRERLGQKNKATINTFLGNGCRADAVAIAPRYYGELFTWALHRYIEKNQWKVVRVLNYQSPEPVYIDVNTDYDKRENLLINGQLLIEKDNCRLIVTVDINLKWRNSVRVEALASKKKAVQDFIDGINTVADEQNIYRNKSDYS